MIAVYKRNKASNRIASVLSEPGFRAPILAFWYQVMEVLRASRISSFQDPRQVLEG